MGAFGKIVGGVASPLLANLYMRRFVLGWKVLGHADRLNAHIVNYADDFVICCRRGSALQAMAVIRNMMSKLRLTVNEKKTRRCCLGGHVHVFGVHVRKVLLAAYGRGIYRPSTGGAKGSEAVSEPERAHGSANVPTGHCGQGANAQPVA